MMDHHAHRSRIPKSTSSPSSRSNSLNRLSVSVIVTSYKEFLTINVGRKKNSSVMHNKSQSS